MLPLVDLPPGLSALCVDDNPVNRNLLATFLRRAGLTVDVVETGAAAIAALRERVYDIVLMDVELPDMDGIQATRSIRALDCAGARAPIVAVTANAEIGLRERYLAAGMDDYLAKPIMFEALVDMIKRLTRGRPSPA